MRGLWLAVGSFFAAFTLLFSGIWVAAAFARDTDTFQVTVDEPVARVVIDADVGGDVRVVGTQGDEVVVDGTTHRGLVEPDHDEVVAGETLTLSSDCGPVGPLALAMFCSLDYVVQVPAGTDLEVHGHAGTVSIVGTSGEVHVDVLGGRAELDDLSGPVQVETRGGGVRGERLASSTVTAETAGGGVDLAFVESPDQVSVSASGGGTTVLLPPGDVGYALDTQASGGSEIIDVRTDPDAARVLKLRTSGGGITVRYGEVR
ncbi:hypothetical protein B7486_64745 [cyanobacterium TDX16]|nr:hypothetical protein B7486_64745 [cyanobacterium TDX16]